MDGANNTNAAATAAAKIGENQIRTAQDTLRKYKQGKARLEKRIIENEQYWKLRHWQQMKKEGQGGNGSDPEPASGWLVNVVLNRHADAMDSYPEPNFLPRAADDREEADRLKKIVPVILKRTGFKRRCRYGFPPSLRKCRAPTAYSGTARRTEDWATSVSARWTC